MHKELGANFNISCRNFKRKQKFTYLVTDRNRQEQTGKDQTDRNGQNR